MAEGGVHLTVECGFCLYRDERLVDPRVLPCTHVYCRGCLEGYLEEHGVIDCRSCR